MNSCADNQINSGDTAFILVSTAFVLFMSFPGLTLMYGGLTRSKNKLSTIAHILAITCIIPQLWFIFGYSLAFTRGNAFIGGSDRLWLIGTRNSTSQKSQERLGPHTKHELNCDIPESVFMLFQCAFAIVSANILYGAIMERIKFGAIVLFIPIWHIAVYCIIAHWAWSPDGFLNKFGSLDFAGGDVVHISAGVSAFVAAWFIGPRKDTRKGLFSNPSDTLSGVAFLFFGWFGFNGGSAGHANGQAGMAIISTTISATAGGSAWLFIDSFFQDGPSLIGMASGVVAGLVAITPACGYVDQTAAFFIGIFGSLGCYGVLYLLNMHAATEESSQRTAISLESGLEPTEATAAVSRPAPTRLRFPKIDDACDVFVIHGVGGAIGTLLTGFFANDFVSGLPDARGAFYGQPEQIYRQLVGIFVTAGWSAGMTLVILFALDRTLKRLPSRWWSGGIRASDQTLERGMDSVLTDAVENGTPAVPSMSSTEGDPADGQARKSSLAASATAEPSAAIDRCVSEDRGLGKRDPVGISVSVG